MKEIKDGKTDGEIFHVAGQEESILLKMTILPNAIYRFNVIPIKLPMAFFTELEQKISHSYGNRKDPKQPKQNGAGGIKLPDFRLYYEATVIWTVWCWQKNRTVYQWKKIESPEINPCTYGAIFLTNEARIYNGAKTASSINDDGEIQQLHVKE